MSNPQTASKRLSKEEYKAREKDIITMYHNRYFLAEIGRKYGITRQRVYSILKNARKRGVKRAYRLSPKSIDSGKR